MDFFLHCVFGTVTDGSENNPFRNRQWKLLHKLFALRPVLSKNVLPLIYFINVYVCVHSDYKDRKCAVNENPSVRIELARSKTSNNGPLRNGSVVSIARLCVGSKIVCFYESGHAFKTIWQRPCSFHLIKIKASFLKPDRLVFIIVINTSCSGVCYRIYARQKFFNNALAPSSALALFGIFAGCISCNKRPHTQYLLLH